MPLKKRFITKSTTDQSEITESIPDKPKSKLDYLHQTYGESLHNSDNYDDDEELRDVDNQ